jgi:hypothetical protein
MLLGDVRRKLCKFTEALVCYEYGLELEPLDVLALKGKADVCLAFAYQYFSIGIPCSLIFMCFNLTEFVFITYLEIDNGFLVRL